ncbi:hypothetical protein QQ045_017349 [Rhodiola kirilowii]
MLTMGGRLTLVEAILNFMVVHILASLPTPIGVIDRINSLLSNFIWDSGGQSRRHWVNWPDICKSKQCGGLGIRNLKDIRQAFLYKMAWRCMDPTSLWGRFVRSTYRVGTPCSHIWTHVSKVLPDLRAQCSWNIGKGDINVANFCWLYGATPPLALRALPMHVILADQDNRDALIQCLPSHGQHSLQTTTISDTPDSLEWCRSSSGVFTTKEFHLMRNNPVHIDKIMSTIWRPWLPPSSVCFFGNSGTELCR